MNASNGLSHADLMSALSTRSRLAALDRSGLMDSAEEAVFDRATRLASRVLAVPVSLLSLVDTERQFFKAQTGLDGWPATRRGTPLTHSFCKHVVASDAPLVVRDARSDPMVRENLAIRDLHVIAYLGVPVHAPGGEPLGSLCAISDAPKDWTDDDLQNLKDIAAGVESEIAVRFALADARESEGKVSAILEQMPIGVALAANETGELLYLNRRGKEKVGQNLAAHDADDYGRMGALHPDGRSYAAEDYPLVRAALHGEVVRDEPMTYRRPDGTTLELDVHAARIEGHDLAIATFRDVTARNVARRDREQIARRMAGVLEATTDAVFVLDPDWRVLYANEAARTFGYDVDRLVGQVVHEVLPDIEATPFWEVYQRARETGEPQTYEDMDRYSGRLVEVRVFPRGGELIVVGRDVADERRTEAQRKVIVRELNHRVKNLFAVISGMIGMTARTADTPAEMARTLRGRVAALARAHEMIRPAITSEVLQHDEVDLADLVRAVIAPHAGHTADAVVDAGPAVALGPQSATSMALALHELATNAAKYGALRDGAGSLSVRWTATGDRLRLVWDERTPDAAGPPESTGFGATLIEMSARVQLQGEVTTDWHPEGLRVTLDLPRARLAG